MMIYQYGGCMALNKSKKKRVNIKQSDLSKFVHCGLYKTYSYCAVEELINIIIITWNKFNNNKIYINFQKDFVVEQNCWIDWISPHAIP